MSTILTEKERKRRRMSEVDGFLQWLESIGGFLAMLGRLLLAIGLAIVRIVQIIRGYTGTNDWREQYV